MRGPLIFVSRIESEFGYWRFWITTQTRNAETSWIRIPSSLSITRIIDILNMTLLLLVHLRHVELEDSSGVVVLLDGDLSYLQTRPLHTGLAWSCRPPYQLHAGDINQETLGQLRDVILWRHTYNMHTHAHAHTQIFFQVLKLVTKFGLAVRAAAASANNNSLATKRVGRATTFRHTTERNILDIQTPHCVPLIMQLCTITTLTKAGSSRATQKPNQTQCF